MRVIINKDSHNFNLVAKNKSGAVEMTIDVGFLQSTDELSKISVLLQRVYWAGQNQDPLYIEDIY